MSVMDQIKKLDEQKAKLLADAKAEAMAKVEQGLQDLKELGFSYRLVTDDNFTPPVSRQTRTRRGGVKDSILAALSEKPMSRSELLVHLDAKGDKGQENSISTALANMKKAGIVTAEDGVYKKAG